MELEAFFFIQTFLFIFLLFTFAPRARAHRERLCKYQAIQHLYTCNTKGLTNRKGEKKTMVTNEQEITQQM